jgi:hypothetical protein
MGREVGDEGPEYDGRDTGVGFGDSGAIAETDEDIVRGAAAAGALDGALLGAGAAAGAVGAAGVAAGAAGAGSGATTCAETAGGTTSSAAKTARSAFMSLSSESL